MKKIALVSIALLSGLSLWAQEYQFKVVKENAITSIKNQASSGTCWSFSGVAFLESELLRTGKGEHDLSEMYIVRRNYEDKADKYVRLHGSLNFAQGGSFADVIETLDEYGVLPNEQYTGLNYGESGHKHGEMESILTGFVKAVTEKKNGKVSTAWFGGFNGVLDSYLGVKPNDFTYQGKNYTAKNLAENLGLKADNYVSITSFTHHPFYAPFAVEVPDNWRWALSYNLPLDEMMHTIDHAIENGYTIAWATDVSETGFTRNGIAVVPDDAAPENIGSDQAHWLGLSAKDKVDTMRKKIEVGPVKELSITQELRQKGYDNYETTDDHGMQIYGIAKDQNGTKYYMVKNSWGEAGKYKGLWYASEAFVKYKTISIVINKSSLPKDVASKLKIK